MINRRLLRIDVFQVLYELVCHAQSAAGQPDPVAPTANEGDVAVVQATPELLRRGEQRLGEAMQAYIELTHLLLELPLEFQRANARLLALREKRMLSTLLHGLPSSICGTWNNEKGRPIRRTAL